MKKVLFIVNHPVVIYNFRKELVEKLIENNYKVFVSCPYGPKIEYLKSLGCIYVEASIERHGMNIIDELKLFSYYRKIIKNIKPDVVLTYTIKPNIYGSLASKTLGVPSIANITGLGMALQKKNMVSKILISLYKLSLSNAKCVFFQNEENQRFFIQNKVPMKKYQILPGSGVNLKQYAFSEYPKDEKKIRFLFIGRVMRDKGIEELISAAKIIREKNKKVNFDIVGFYEDDYKKRVDELSKLDIVQFHGSKEDIQEYIKNSHAVILPSYHEGMANVLLEAAAMGRPVIASNIPGCIETFDEGISGLGFEPRNASDLKDTLNTFLDLSHLDKRAMGIAGRKKMEKQFDRSIVVKAYFEEIDKILNNSEENVYELI